MRLRTTCNGTFAVVIAGRWVSSDGVYLNNCWLTIQNIFYIVSTVDILVTIIFFVNPLETP